MEKQIEEMAEILAKNFTLYDGVTTFCAGDFEWCAYQLMENGYRKERQGECPYCKDRTLTELPLKTNCDTSRVGVLIAQGDKKKEIVFWSQIGTYGIEINYCPICGAKMRGE